MGTIHNLASRFASLNFDQIKQQSLRETAPAIIPEMNIEQLKHGKLSDDNPIVPKLENITYAIDKENKNGLNGRTLLTPDLKNTGGFYEGITTTVTRLTIKTFSIDLKSPKLEARYSKLIYGPNTANLSKYAIEDLKPVLMSKLKTATIG